MTDYELMGLALEQAAQAAQLGRCRWGAVVARHGQVIAAAHNTRETEKMPCIMRSCWPLMRPAKHWAGGGCGSASCLLPWNPAPCAAAPS